DPNSAASAGLRDSAGQFDPLAEARKRWPGLASADDQTLYRKLSDPANFRAAFPEYGGLDDATIQRNMARYDPAAGLRTLEAEGVRPVQPLDAAYLARARAAEPRESLLGRLWRAANTPVTDIANRYEANQGDPPALAMEREGGPTSALEQQTVSELGKEPALLRGPAAVATAVPNGVARMATPLGIATLGFGPLAEGLESAPLLSKAAGLAGTGADVAFGAEGAKDALTGRQPGESEAD